MKWNELPTIIPSAYPTKEKQRSETLNRVMATAFEAIAIALFNL